MSGAASPRAARGVASRRGWRGLLAARGGLAGRRPRAVLCGLLLAGLVPLLAVAIA